MLTLLARLIAWVRGQPVDIRPWLILCIGLLVVAVLLVLALIAWFGVPVWVLLFLVIMLVFIGIAIDLIRLVIRRGRPQLILILGFFLIVCCGLFALIVSGGYLAPIALMLGVILIVIGGVIGLLRVATWLLQAPAPGAAAANQRRRIVIAVLILFVVGGVCFLFGVLLTLSTAKQVARVPTLIPSTTGVPPTLIVTRTLTARPASTQTPTATATAKIATTGPASGSVPWTNAQIAQLGPALTAIAQRNPAAPVVIATQPLAPTATQTATATATQTPTATSTSTQTPTNTPTATQTATATSTSTQTPTNTPTWTPTATQTVADCAGKPIMVELVQYKSDYPAYGQRGNRYQFCARGLYTLPAGAQMEALFVYNGHSAQLGDTSGHRFEWGNAGPSPLEVDLNGAWISFPTLNWANTQKAWVQVK